MGDLKVGDYVISWWGNPVRIQYIPFEGVSKVYRFTFNDGTTLEASEDHEWFCKGPKQRFKLKEGDEEWVVKSTREIIADGKYSPETDQGHRFTIPVSDPVKFEGKVLFDPYMMGLLLGDGSLGERSQMLTSADQEIVDYIKSKYTVHPNGRYGYRLKASTGIKDILGNYGLLKTDCFNKFIPEDYFWGSIDQRMELLRGLMDTDGTVNTEGLCSFTTSSQQLATDIRRLVDSLGGLTFIKERQGKYKKNGQHFITSKHYQIRVAIQTCPFKLSRKKARYRFQTRNKHERVIYNIEEIGKKPVRCITVTGEGSFLAGRNFVVTHNSSTQIRKAIHWATEPSLWKELWPIKPITFWYLYPSLKVWDLEVRKKWVPEFLPREEFKDDPQYGYKLERGSNGLIQAIAFNSGVSIIGKSYLSDLDLLQTGTVWYLAFDEEMPVELWPELQMRVAATDGYISGVFTPTLSQQFWYEVMEVKGHKEKLREAHKITASLYDCLKYEDGSKSPWTRERINKIKNTLPTEDEIQRRVHGKFIINKTFLKYPSFSQDKNYGGGGPVPKDWVWYVGIDSGSGGTGRNHPAAIAWVAVSPDYKRGRVVEVWHGTPENVRGESKDTTAADVLRQYLDMRGDRDVVLASYDHNDRDMGIIGERDGIALEKADKRHDFGEGLLNTLFKNQLLSIDKVPENFPLVDEFLTLRRDTPKNAAVDDCIDSVRYAVTKIPWDLTEITGNKEIIIERRIPTTAEMVADRRLSFAKDDELTTIDQQIEELNELYEG